MPQANRRARITITLANLVQLVTRSVFPAEPLTASDEHPQQLFHATSRALAKDPYATLNVSKTASASEIKKAYYKVFSPDCPEMSLTYLCFRPARQAVSPRHQQVTRGQRALRRDSERL